MTGEILAFLSFFKELLSGNEAKEESILRRFRGACMAIVKVHDDYKLSLSRYREMALGESQTIQGANPGNL